MNRHRQTNPWKEVIGIGLILLGALLFVALISFDRADLPGWVPLIGTSQPNNPMQNLVGIVGALMAGYIYFLFGAAAYWIALILMGFGIGKLLVDRFELLFRSGWGLVNVMATASLFNRIFDWNDYIYKGNWAGGWVGHYVGDLAFGGPFGSLGSVIVLIGLYLVSLIFMTGFHPILFVRQVIEWSQATLAARRARRKAEMEPVERIELEREEIVRRTEKLEKKLRKTKVPKEPEEPEEPKPALAEREPVPEPKIIDASIPATPKKPTLAELDAARAAAKPVPAAASGTGLSEVHVENYQLPPLDLLDAPDLASNQPADPQELLSIQHTILDTLAQFGIEAQAGDITKGPTITRYEIYPAKGVRVDRITSLERDIARATKAERINILAPIPGKDTVGIEVANAKKVKVTLRELFETEAWTEVKSGLPLALGKDVYGHTIIGDLAKMPHCLVAGTTGSGKSVCINSIIASLLFRFTPEELRFIMIDPKVVEMQIYNTLPHLVTPVVTDPKKVLLALKWVIDEMELRYRIFAKCGVRNISSFNARPKPKTQAELDAQAAAEEVEEGLDNPIAEEAAESAVLDEVPEENLPEPEPPPIKVPRLEDELIVPDRMPFIVVIIDELADLMQTAPADVESGIARITQMARAAGIHLIVATQTPRAQVVTGVIKANIPSRIAFQVASALDSRVILDDNGAEKLLGQGDMMYLPPGTSKMTRSQGVLVTDDEIRRIVEFVSKQSEPSFEPSIHQKLTSNASTEEEVTDEDEELVDKCIEIIRQEKRASTSMLQRRLRLGYTRAARVVDILEQRGIVGPRDGARDREILVDLDSL